MKKIMLIIAVVALSISASAQTKYWDSSRPEHRFTFGVRAGINTSKQYAINDQSDHENRLGFHAGLTADINIVRSFSVNTGVMYIQRGWKTDYSDNRGSVEKKDNAAYLEIPVLASYRVNLSDQVQFQLNIGPYFAFGVSGKQKVTNTFPNGDNYDIDSFDSDEGGKKFDCGIVLGAAATYKHCYIGISYERGLTNVSKVAESNFQNGCIALTLGYNF